MGNIKMHRGNVFQLQVNPRYLLFLFHIYIYIQLHSRNHGYFKKLRRAVQSTNLLQDDPEGLIINLSSKSFTVYDFKFLNKGLNFCSTPGSTTVGNSPMI